MMKKNFKRGEVVIKQGDLVDNHLYIVLEGKLSVKRLAGNTVIDCGNVRDGDMFGEMSMILGSARAATIVAEEDSTLEQLDRGEFLELVREKPDIVWKVLKNLAIKTQMLDELQGQISDSAVLRTLLLGKR